MKFNVETVRQLEAEAANFDARIEFSRHIRKLFEAEYEGIELTEAGGLLRTREAEKIDAQLHAVCAEAGYPDVYEPHELASAIWAAQGR